MILVLNAGSSSLRCALFRPGAASPVWRAHAAGIGTDPKLSVDGEPTTGERPPAGDHATVARWLFERLPHTPTAAGHRVVHGGPRYAAPVRLDAEVLAELVGLVPLAPAHQPQAVGCIRATGERWPHLPQVACFDTAFHRTQDRLAQLYPLPRALIDEGLVRFGFHGLSYAHLARSYPTGRVLVAHLGHGASLCAIRDGRSVATTMGFTTLDGLMMGTRSGALDPGLVLYLVRERGLSPDAVAELLNERSGLLGVSGISDDVRVLEASDASAAREALDLFVYGSCGRRALSSPPSAGSTPSSSPAASASTPHRSAPGSVAGSPSRASRSTTWPMPMVNRGSRRPARPSRSASHPRTRSARSPYR